MCSLNWSNHQCYQLLKEAIAHDDHSALERLLPKYLSVDDNAMDILLELAAMSGNICMANYFLQTGVEVDTTSIYYETPLIITAKYCKARTRTAMMRLLIKNGANPFAVDNMNQNALDYCLYNEDLESAKFLLGLGRISSDNYENHLFLRMLETDNPYVFVQGTVTRKRKQQHQHLLQIAALVGNITLTRHFIENDYNVNASEPYVSPPIIQAAKSMRKKWKPTILKELIEAGANVESDPEGYTALHICAGYYGDDVESVAVLVEAGANINYQDSKKQTALHKAAERGNIEIVRYLLKCGANYECRDTNGDSPLHFAADKISELQHDHQHNENLMKVFLDHGVNFNMANNRGETVFEVVLKRGSCEAVEMFMDLGADPSKISAGNSSALHLASMNDMDEVLHMMLKFFDFRDIDRRGTDNMTPLHVAAMEQFPVHVEILLEHGAAVDAIDDAGNTPLLFMLLEAKDGFQHEAEIDLICIVETFFLFGTDVNLRNKRNESILDAVHRLELTLLTTIVIRHIALLDTTNKKVSEHLHLTIKRIKSFNDFYKQCIKELQTLENYKICGSLTAHKLLTCNNQDFTRYVRNKYVIEAFNATKWQKKYPTYAASIMNRFNQEWSQQKTFQKARDTLRDCLPNVGIPDLTIENILHHMSKDDIQDLAESNSNTYLDD